MNFNKALSKAYIINELFLHFYNIMNFIIATFIIIPTHLKLYILTAYIILIMINYIRSDFMEKNFKEELENTKKELSIEKIFKNFNGEYVPVEIDWGQPVGKEIF